MTGTDSAQRLGMIAGAGPLPLIITREASRRGKTVVCAGLEGFCDPDLERLCDRFASFDPGQLTATINFLQEAGVQKVLLCGHIDHSNVFVPHRLDELMASILAGADKRAEALLGRIADAIESRGLPVGDQRTYLGKHLAAEGLLGSVKPSEEARRDLDFAWPLAIKVSELNIGQALIVRDGVVLAVEAMEGTDETIRRAGTLPGNAGAGATVVKLPPRDKDLRFDIPVIGCKTVGEMADIGAVQLAIAAGRTIIIDDPGEFAAAADEAGIAVVARRLPKE